jgi:hypothetical protein
MRGIFCILPPHMLKEIARRGSDHQRDWALRTLTVSEQLRGRRQAFAAMIMRRPTPASGRRTVYDARHGTELPGRVAREEGGKKSKDTGVNEAYDGAGRALREGRPRTEGGGCGVEGNRNLSVRRRNESFARAAHEEKTRFRHRFR